MWSPNLCWRVSDNADQTNESPCFNRRSSAMHRRPVLFGLFSIPLEMRNPAIAPMPMQNAPLRLPCQLILH